MNWFVALVLVALVIYYVVNLLQGRKNAEDPKFSRLPPGAYLPDKRKNDQGCVHNFFYLKEITSKLHAKYGPIVSFWEGDELCVSLASPDLLKSMKNLSTTGAKAFEAFRCLAGDGASVFCGKEEGLQRRKVYDPYFMLKSCKTFMGIFKDVTEGMIRDWKQYGPNDHIPLGEEMHKIGLKCILRTSLGDFFKDEKQLNEFREKFDGVSLLIMSQTALSEEDARKKDEYINYIHTTIREMADRRKATYNGEEEIFLDLLLREEVSDSQRLGDIVGFAIAGTFDLGNALTFALWEIGSRQDVQNKIYEEIKSVLSEKKDVNEENWKEFVYLRMVMEETLRMYGDFNTARVAEEELETGGYLIPKGTTLYFNNSCIFSNPDIYPNPEKFDPERFTPDKVKKRHAFAFKPFGFAGKRQCAGQMFAYSAMTVILVEMLRHLDFKSVPCQNPLDYSSGIGLWTTARPRS